jgi:hypothetical protein
MKQRSQYGILIGWFARRSIVDDRRRSCLVREALLDDCRRLQGVLYRRSDLTEIAFRKLSIKHDETDTRDSALRHQLLAIVCSVIDPLGPEQYKNATQTASYGPDSGHLR